MLSPLVEVHTKGDRLETFHYIGFSLSVFGSLKDWALTVAVSQDLTVPLVLCMRIVQYF